MDKAEAGHIHAHAIIAVRSESGPKLNLAPSDLVQLRVNYAAHAREHGLPIVATRAAEQASSRSYGRRDKAIVDAAANSRSHRMEQDRAYASDPRNANLIRRAQERMAIARANPVRIPMTGRERADVQESLEHWRAVAKANPTNETARTMAERLAAAKEAGDMLDTLKTELSPKPAILNHPSANDKCQAPEMTEHTDKSADAMLRDLRQFNQRIAEVTNLLPEGSRQRFTQQATGYLDKIAERIDQQRAHETKADVPNGANVAARTITSDQGRAIPDPQVPFDPLAELRRQQTEMLERLAQERGKSKHRERSDEQGD
jgi:type IV secretion system T-DNA border endonuclease VirD2